MYRLIRPLLFLLPPETAHALSLKYLKLVQWVIDRDDAWKNDTRSRKMNKR